MNPATGLSQRDARRHRALYGYNHLREAKSVAWWWILGRQFKGLVVALLASAALVSFLFSEIVEGFAIVAVLAINAALGFVAELRAVRSMEALRQLGSEMTRVRRRGRERLIPAELLVPGDIVLFEGGDRITADLRIVEAAQLEADESVLTGESLPVAKLDETLDADIELHARSNMLFKGTTVTRGAGVGVVVSTGMATELGRIAELVAEAEEETTPLERRLEELGRRLVGATFLIAATAAVAGIASGKEIFLMVQTGIALAVAAIPEGLPIVATIALARGMWRMARRNALINRLSAVETLGATTMILTDKTGTLTENRLSVRQIVTDSATYDLETPDVGTTGGTDPGAVNRKLVFRRAGAEVDHDADASLLQALRIGALCSGASISGEPGTWITVGDPLEVALLVAAASAGIERSDLLRDLPEVRE